MSNHFILLKHTPQYFSDYAYIKNEILTVDKQDIDKSIHKSVFKATDHNITFYIILLLKISLKHFILIKSSP